MFDKVIENLFFLSWVVNALLFVPQIILLYKRKDSSDVSLIMFVCFNIIQFITILHGYINKDYLLILGFALTLATSGTVTIMIILYRYRNKNVRQ